MEYQLYVYKGEEMQVCVGVFGLSLFTTLSYSS